MCWNKKKGFCFVSGVGGAQVRFWVRQGMAVFTSLTTPNNTAATGETKKKEGCCFYTNKTKESFYFTPLLTPLFTPSKQKKVSLFLLSYFVVSKLVTK